MTADYRKLCAKEYKRILATEERLRKKARKNSPVKELENKLPLFVSKNTQLAFAKAFEIIFTKGTKFIENKKHNEDIKEFFDVGDDYDKRSLEEPRKNAGNSKGKNTAFAAVEGVILGVLGIGIPDIVIFTAVILKGIYDCALNYGYEYESRRERIFIMMLIEGALSKGNMWQEKSRAVDKVILEGIESLDTSYMTYYEQLNNSASAMAMDMLVLKTIQGMPVAGIIGGLGNPVYYNKILKYATLKYNKRYIIDKYKAYGRDKK